MQQLFYCFPHNNILNQNDKNYAEMNIKKSKYFFILFSKSFLLKINLP